MPPTTAQACPGGWLMTATESSYVKSAYGDAFEPTDDCRHASSSGGVGLGKDAVALDTMKNVAAGAMTLSGRGIGVLDRCAIGTTDRSDKLKIS